MDSLRTLVKAECERVIELLKDKETFAEGFCINPKRAELKAKMVELRRDTLRLEKELYHWGA